MYKADVHTATVVVPTHARRDLLSQTVKPLLTSGALEVIVVVDGADDGSLEMLQELAHDAPVLRPVWQANGGAGVARQTGLEHARGDVVLFLDDDVLAGPGLVAGHAAAQADRDGLVVLGYMPTPVPTQRRAGQFATFLYSAEYEAACRRYENNSVEVLNHLWAGNFSLRRKDALRVGMDGGESVGAYHEDTEFGLRCAAAGLTGLFDRRLVSEHVHLRPLPAFASDARAQGAGRVRLAVLHPETVTLPGDDEFLDGLPPAVRTAARNSVTLGVSCCSLKVAVRILGRVHAYGGETAAAKVLRRLEQVRGARLERAALGLT